MPDLVAAALALGAGALLTGALHEDGLADVADGFGGGRDVEAKLAIMRDSRIGTYGAMALMVSFATKLSALAAIPDGYVVPEPDRGACAGARRVAGDGVEPALSRGRTVWPAPRGQPDATTAGDRGCAGAADRLVSLGWTGRMWAAVAPA